MVDSLQLLAWIWDQFPRPGRKEVGFGRFKVYRFLVKVMQHFRLIRFSRCLVRLPQSLELDVLISLDLDSRQDCVPCLGFYVSAKWLSDQVRLHLL